MKKKTVIIGAGEAGKMVAREILDTSRLANQFELVGFFDDDRSKKTVLGKPVLSNLHLAPEYIRKNEINTVIIAIPSASRELITPLITNVSSLNVAVKIVPGIYEIIEGDVHWNQIRDIKPDDLLGREEVGFDFKQLNPFYEDKTIFITGAGGSIGSVLFKQLLKLPIKKIIAMGRGENNIHPLITETHNDPRVGYVIGNIKDKNKIDFEIQKHSPDIIFHAAAHKHVPMMEEFPEEAVKNNIIGTYNVATAAIKADVKNFVLISTDKAVRPTSVMGATKRIAEKIILSLNQKNRCKFLLTRFGNVLGSRGSVIPTFLKQIQNGGPITITDKNIERYFMSIPEAARLVMKSVTVKFGHIFVLNMGKPIKIIDLAKNLIKLSGFTEDEIPIVFTGLRKGEKLYEELFFNHEDLLKTDYDKLLVAKDFDCFDIEKVESIIKEFQILADKIARNDIKKTIKKYLSEYSG